MKKIISLILVVLLCLPASFIAVSAEGADTYTVTAADGANTTSNDYLNINKYLVYYDGGDELYIPKDYITVGQWKENIANPSINADGLADDDYITSDCTMTLTMDDGTTTKTVYVDAVDYNYLFREYDKKETTTIDSNTIGLTYSRGSNGDTTTGVTEVSDGEYGITISWDKGSTDTGKVRWYQFGVKLADMKSNIADYPYVIETTMYADAPGTSTASLLFTYGGSQQATVSNTALLNKVKSGEPFTVTAHIFPKSLRADYYLDGELIKENLSVTGEKNSVATDYSNYETWGIRFINDSKVDGEYADAQVVITDHQVRYGFGNQDSEIYVAPTVEITNYTDGENVKPEDVEDIQVTTNSEEYPNAELYVDDTKAATGTVSDKKVTLDSSALVPGEHEVEVRLCKASGKYITSGKVNVNVAGTVSIDNYTDGTTVYEDTIVPLVAVTDSTYYTKAKLYIDGTEADEADVVNKEAELDISSMGFGEHKVEVRMYGESDAYISDTVTLNRSDLTAADIYTIKDADGADTTSDDYLNIYKYLAYYDGGEELNIPESYITVGQWKENIANPSINANGLSDSAYITSDCTLTMTMYDGRTTKTVYVNAVDYNYLYKEYDNTSLIDTTAYTKNDLQLRVNSSPSNGTFTGGNKVLDNEKFAISALYDNFTTTAKPYTNVGQYLGNINSDIDIPYMVDLDITFEKYNGLGNIDFLLVGASNTNYQGKQRANVSLPGSVKTKLQTGNSVRLTYVVYPKANRADVYADGVAVVENLDLVYTNDLGTSTYNECSDIMIRVYNTVMVDGEYQTQSYYISRYEIRYGYGNIDSEIYVPPTVEITNYESGSDILSTDITSVEAVTNRDDYKTAALYIDGVKVDEVSVSGLSASLDASSMGYGEHTIEVRMYPETGAYISDSVTVNVKDMVEVSDYIVTFSEFKADSVPTTISGPASYISNIYFYNISNESLTDSTVIVNDAYVRYYDEERGNVLHAKADPESNTSIKGRRIEFAQQNTANNMSLSFDVYYESFSGVSMNLFESRNTSAKGHAELTGDGVIQLESYKTALTSATSYALETGKWYTIEADFFLTMGGLFKLRIYDENGDLLCNMEAIYDADYTTCARIYFPYNPDDLSRGESYYDNVKVSIFSATGSISEITADVADVYTVSAVLSSVSAVNDVEISNADGNIDILGYAYDSGTSTLTITTSVPLNAVDEYLLSVYADGNAVPLTSGFVLTGGYIKVTDSYFDHIKGKDCAVLNVSNTTGKEGKITVLISEWDSEELVSMKAKTISVATGENAYSVEITGASDNVKVMAVSSLAKPILLSKDVLSK